MGWTSEVIGAGVVVEVGTVVLSGADAGGAVFAGFGRRDDVYMAELSVVMATYGTSTQYAVGGDCLQVDQCEKAAGLDAGGEAQKSKR